MKRFLTLTALFLSIQFPTLSQRGMTFQEAESMGISVSYLDSTYKSAIHSDRSKAVFKTRKQQKKMQHEYTKMLQQFGVVMSESNFNFGRTVRSFNRVYFNADGTIAYFLYNFRKEENITEEQLAEFNRLLNGFIAHYKLGINAKEQFAQCSPAIYAQ